MEFALRNEVGADQDEGIGSMLVGAKNGGLVMATNQPLGLVKGTIFF